MIQKLKVLSLFLFSNSLFSQAIKIKLVKFDGNSIPYTLTSDDTAAIISLAEEEGVDSVCVIKTSEIRMMVTMKCDGYDIQYLLCDRYIDKIIKYYPNKTLFYDKNYKRFKPKAHY